MDDGATTLCVRLYGKHRKHRRRPKCYAECVVPWAVISEGGLGLVEVEGRMRKFKKKKKKKDLWLDV